MSRLIAKHALEKRITNNILSISAEASASKEADPSTINGTIGSLFDENGKMIKFNSVMKVLDNLTDKERFAYSQTDGGKKFRESIMKWAFQDNYDLITKQMFCNAIATPGGSGAVGSTIANYANQGDAVLTSDLGWSPYEVMAKENFCSIDYYHLFDENNKFNLKDYKEHADGLIKKQGRLLAVINDPCHNPTGFALSLNDWKEIVKHANESKVPYVILLDMAYIDYLPEGIKASREVLKEFLNINDNVIVILGFSGSKTFSVYGMRLGAQVCIAKTNEAMEDFFYANEFSGRARWSNINHAGLALVEHIMNDGNLTKDFTEELVQASKMLSERSEIFLKEADAIGLAHYPYKGGFFITIPCDGTRVFEALKATKVFVVPLKYGIRISLSALSKSDINGLAQKIQDVL